MADFTAREVALIANTDVLGYIQARNKEINTQAREEGWDFWTTAGEDSAVGCVNLYEYLKQDAISFHSDVFKEINGFRPRHINYTATTLEELEALNEELTCEDEANLPTVQGVTAGDAKLGDIYPEPVTWF